MRPSEIVKAIDVCVKAKQPVMLQGSPGVGKSQVVAQVAKNNDMEMIDVRLSQLDPVDLRGVPSVDPKKKQTSWNVPDFLPTEGRGILFLDEINSAAQATQAAAYQLVLDRKLGDYELPEGWTIVAAGNRMSDNAIVNQMSTALKNRFVHLDFEVNNEDWTQWALKAGIRTEVIGFIRFRPLLLNEFEKRNDSEQERKRIQSLKDSQAFATPRSWEFLSRLIDQNPPDEVVHELISGTVGEAAAAEFAGYLKYHRKVPNIDKLLMDPKNAPIPEEPAILIATVTAVAARASEDNFERVVAYTDRLSSDFQVMLMKDAITREGDLADTRGFADWATRNPKVVF